jgi:hypothetical protein
VDGPPHWSPVTVSTVPVRSAADHVNVWEIVAADPALTQSAGFGAYDDRRHVPRYTESVQVPPVSAANDCHPSELFTRATHIGVQSVEMAQTDAGLVLASNTP